MIIHPIQSITAKHLYIVVDFDEIVYAGINYLPAIVRLDDLIKLPSFDKTKPYIVKILKHYPDHIQARNALNNFIILACNALLPKYNMLSTYNCRAHRKIFCNENQTEYKSAHHACQVLGLHQGNLSNHLQGKTGFRTIKGYTFRYVQEESQYKTNFVKYDENLISSLTFN